MGVRTASVAGLLLVLLAALAPTTWAQQRAVGWQRYDVDLAIAPDGSVAVTETQAIQFQGTFQMGFRVIPTDRVTSVDNVSVAEVVNGQTVAYRPTQTQAANGFSTVSTDQGLEIDWWFPPTTNAARTFVLRYTLHGALRIYDAGDQLQWKAIYADRGGPIAASAVTVHLPADVPGNALQTSYSRYTADQDTRANALPSDGTGQQTDPRTVHFGTGQLPTGTGVEVRVQFPHGLVSASPPPWQADADRADWIAQTVTPIATFLMLLLSLVVLVGGGVGLFVVWYTSGRDPSPGAVPPRLDQPPSALPAPLAGTLVDEVADVQDAVATLVDLGGRGVLSMTDEDNPRLAGAPRDVRITLHQALPDDGREYERLLVGALFGPDAKPGDEVVLSRVGGRFAAAIPALQASLYREVADEGWFVRNPDAVRQRYRQLGWVLVGVGVACAIVAALILGWATPIAWLPGLALAMVGLGCMQVARAMPRRTRPGALEAARWRAFRAHLQDLGGARQSEYLPYAVAFGIDRDFLHRLEQVGTPPPSWYPYAGGGWGGPGGVIIVPGGFGHGRGSWSEPGQSGGTGGTPSVPGPQGWSDALADMLNGASEALARGGGSGGWSGGGFGGGGGGGGGSGGFR